MIKRFLEACLDWENWMIFLFQYGYIIGLLPIIIGFAGAVYFKPCSFGLC